MKKIIIFLLLSHFLCICKAEINISFLKKIKTQKIVDKLYWDKGNYILFSTIDGYIHLYRPPHNSIFSSYISKQISNIELNEKVSLFFVTFRDNISIFDFNSNLVWNYTTDDWIKQTHFSPDGRHIGALLKNNRFIVLDIEKKNVVLQEKINGKPFCFSFGKDYREVIFGTSGGITFYLYSFVLPLWEKEITLTKDVKIYPADKKIFVLTSSGGIYLFDFTGELTFTGSIGKQSNNILFVNKKYLLIKLKNSNIVLTKISPFRSFFFELGTSIRDISYSKEKNELIVSSWKKHISIYQIKGIKPFTITKIEKKLSPIKKKRLSISKKAIIKTPKRPVRELKKAAMVTPLTQTKKNFSIIYIGMGLFFLLFLIMLISFRIAFKKFFLLKKIEKAYRFNDRKKIIYLAERLKDILPFRYYSILIEEYKDKNKLEKLLEIYYTLLPIREEYRIEIIKTLLQLKNYSQAFTEIKKLPQKTNQDTEKIANFLQEIIKNDPDNKEAMTVWQNLVYSKVPGQDTGHPPIVTTDDLYRIKP